MKRILSIVLMMALLMSSVSLAESNPGFSDITSDHWAYEAVMVMASKGILNGYDDNTFRPEVEITRGEFATIMVKAMGLSVNKYANSSFIDMSNDHWAVPYVEVAQNYLTGYQTSSGVKFKPDDAAVREDMAVAIVIAKSLEVNDADKDYLNSYIDESQVAAGLQKYVGAAIRNGLMIGSVVDGQKVFNPLGKLTRAEAAVLLMNLVEEEMEEKIVLEDKVVIEDIRKVDLEVVDYDGQLKLKWDVTSVNGLKGFKVVASKYNSAPSYPDDGYVQYISDTSVRHFVVSEYSKNHNGDFSQFASGQEYYFTITALYDDEKVTSNAVKRQMPEKVVLDLDLNLYVVQKDGHAVLEWEINDDSTVTGFKVVASRYDDTPTYPENGYLDYVNTYENRRYEVSTGDKYYEGDFSKFEAGENYFFRIIAFTHSGDVFSNVVNVKFDEVVPPQVNLEYGLDGNKIILEWVSYNDHNVEGFKVVASKYDSTPAYPDNGYYKYVRIGSDERVVIEEGAKYNNGDFDYFRRGETYYFTITTIYGGGKVNSNIVKVDF